MLILPAYLPQFYCKAQGLVSKVLNVQQILTLFLPGLLCCECYDNYFSNRHNLQTSINGVRWNVLFILNVRTNQPIHYKSAQTFVNRYYKETIVKKRLWNCCQTAITGRQGVSWFFCLGWKASSETYRWKCYFIKPKQIKVSENLSTYKTTRSIRIVSLLSC